MVGLKNCAGLEALFLLETFVKNKYKVFRTHYSVWGHRVGMKNPANLHSREMKLSDLKDNQFYWQGPPWLNKYMYKLEWSSEQANYCLLEASTKDACQYSL